MLDELNKLATEIYGSKDDDNVVELYEKFLKLDLYRHIVEYGYFLDKDTIFELIEFFKNEQDKISVLLNRLINYYDETKETLMNYYLNLELYEICHVLNML